MPTPGLVMLGRVALGLVALGLTALAGPADAQSVFDFISFDGIDYIRWAEEPGRALARSDLGVEFATVGCSIGEDVRGCAYGMDAAAAFVPAGTRVYAVRGYKTEFRLAAVWQDHILLYQAWRNPGAKVGGDLFDIAGKVRAVHVRRGDRTAAGSPVAITSPRDVDALVGMIVRGITRRPRARAFGEPRCWLTLWLVDGTTLGRAYFIETGELMGDVIVPAEFRSILETYLGE